MSRLHELNIFNQIKFETLDLRDIKNVNKVLKEYRPVYFAHLGSQSSVKMSYIKPNMTNESNLIISKNIIDSIEKYSKETIFFFPSSATIYEGYQNKTVSEKTNPQPKSIYSLSKFTTQKYIHTKLQDSDLQLNCGIMFSHESEFRRPNFFSKKIVEFLVNYKNNNTLRLKVGDLSIKRDIGYAEEYMEATYQILKQNNKSEYIVSSNCLYKLSDFVETCLKILDINYIFNLDDTSTSFTDKKTGIDFILSENAEFREFDLRGIKGDNSKIQEDLDWLPKVRIEEICKKMINFELKKVNN